MIKLQDIASAIPASAKYLPVVFGILIGACIIMVVIVAAKKLVARHNANVDRLKHYLVVNLVQGYSASELEKLCSAQGWSKRVIEHALSLAMPDVFSLQAKRAESSKLEGFVRSDLAKGCSVDQIKFTLVSSGWNRSLVDEAVDRLAYDHNTSKLKAEAQVGYLKQAQDYVVSLKRSGYSLGRIRSLLVSGGYEDNEVDRLLAVETNIN
jgi:hypothetical protein